MVSEFPQEISEALRKEKAACATTALEACAFCLGIATLFFSSAVCITQGFGGKKTKAAIRKLSEKMGKGSVKKDLCYQYQNLSGGFKNTLTFFLLFFTFF